MRARILSAVVLAPCAIALAVIGGAPYLCGVAVMCALAAWEAAALFSATAGLPPDGRWRGLTAA
jgi:hypothetical protein